MTTIPTSGSDLQGNIKMHDNEMGMAPPLQAPGMNNGMYNP